MFDEAAVALWMVNFILNEIWLECHGDTKRSETLTNKHKFNRTITLDLSRGRMSANLILFYTTHVILSYVCGFFTTRWLLRIVSDSSSLNDDQNIMSVNWNFLWIRSFEAYLECTLNVLFFGTNAHCNATYWSFDWHTNRSHWLNWRCAAFNFILLCFCSINCMQIFLFLIAGCNGELI